jgi:hypothetical protein
MNRRSLNRGQRKVIAAATWHLLSVRLLERNTAMLAAEPALFNCSY